MLYRDSYISNWYCAMKGSTAKRLGPHNDNDVDEEARAQVRARVAWWWMSYLILSVYGVIIA